MKSAAPVILIEVVLIFGSALTWALYELYHLRRDKRRDEERRSAEAKTSAPPTEKPADDPAQKS